MKHHLAKVTLNLFAVALLITLIAVPFYFGKNFSQVAGVKNELKYLVLSQTDKFPGMTFAQNNETIRLQYSKISLNQAFLGVMILTNPSDEVQKYKIEPASGKAQAFFGEDLSQKINTVSLVPKASTPISFFSGILEASGSSQTLEFRITADNE